MGLPTFVSVGQSESANSVASGSFVHTLSSVSNGGLFIALGFAAGAIALGANQVRHVRVGGQDAVEIIRRLSTGDDSHGLGWWYLSDPPTGATTISYSFTTSVNDLAAQSVLYSDVDQTLPWHNLHHQGFSLTSSVSFSVTSSTSELVIEAIYHDDTDTLTALASQTVRSTVDPPLNDGTLALADKAGAAQVKLEWSTSGDEEIVHAALSLFGADDRPTTIAKDTIGDGIAADGTLSVSWSHSNIGGNYLVVALGYLNLSGAGGEDVASVTIGAQSASLLGKASHVSSSGEWNVELWGLLAPTGGSQACRAGFDRTMNDIQVNSFAFTGVDQSTPTGTVATQNGNAEAVTLTVSSTVGELVIGAAYKDGTGPLWPTTGLVEYYRQRPPLDDGLLIFSVKEAEALTKMDYSLRGPINWANIGVALKPATTTKTVTLDGILQKIGDTKTAVLNAQIIEVQTLAATLNAIAQETKTESATLNGVVQKINTLTATMNAQLAGGTITLSADLNAIVQKVNTLTAVLNAIIQEQGLTKTADVDALLAEIRTLTTTMNGVLVATQTLTTTFNGVNVGTVQLTAALDGALQRTEALSVGLDAIIEYAFGVWAKRAQSSASWSDQSAGSASWSKQSGGSAAWTDKSGASGSWSDVDPANPTSWT